MNGNAFNMTSGGEVLIAPQKMVFNNNAHISFVYDVDLASASAFELKFRWDTTGVTFGTQLINIIEWGDDFTYRIVVAQSGGMLKFFNIWGATQTETGFTIAQNQIFDVKWYRTASNVILEVKVGETVVVNLSNATTANTGTRALHIGRNIVGGTYQRLLGKLSFFEFRKSGDLNLNLPAIKASNWDIDQGGSTFVAKNAIEGKPNGLIYGLTTANIANFYELI